MLDRDTAEALFLEHLEWIGRVTSKACGSQGYVGSDAEDFTAFVRIKLIEDDYAAVRRFKGDAGFKSYLATIIGHQLVSYIRDERGRWRPSAAAKRAGSVGIELERMVRGGGYTLQQAGEKLRTTGRTSMSDFELARMSGQFPHRSPLRPEVREPVVGMDAPGDSRADERVTEADADSRRAEMLGMLESALEQLEPDDRVIVGLHFGQGYTVADVARALLLEQKPLYRRVARLRDHLRMFLESAGLHRDDVRGLLDESDSQ